MTTFSSTRWLRTAAAVFVLTVAAGAILTALQPKVYVATAQIRTGLLTQLTDGSRKAELEIFQSADVLSPIITDLGLDQKWAQRIYKSDRPLSPQDALAYLRHNLSLDYNRNTNIVSITVSGDLPQETAAIANAIVDRYKIMCDESEDQKVNRGTEALRDQIAQWEKVVAGKQAAVARIEAELEAKGIFPPGRADDGEGGEDIFSQLNNRKRALHSALEDYDARKALVEAAQKLPDDKFLSMLQGLGRLPKQAGPVQARIGELESEISALVQSGAPANDPRVTAPQAELASNRQQLASLVTGLRQAMQVDAGLALIQTVVQRKQFDQAEATVEAESFRNPKGALRPWFDAEHDLQQAQALLDALNVRLIQVLADTPLPESPVRIISRAEAPSAPATPNMRVDLLLSALAGLILGPLAATLVEGLIWLRRSSPKAKNPPSQK